MADNKMGQTRKPSQNELLQCRKIASVFKGYISHRPDNLRTILDAVDSAKFPTNLPVAFLSVIGPKGSGKTFLTNFIIQYLRADGWNDGGWMSSITKGQPFERGISWASVSNEALYRPTLPCSSTSGVYLWPEPFLLEKSAGNDKIAVWVMHLDSIESDTDRNLNALEMFLALACSRIMEIRTDNDDGFRLLDHYRSLSQADCTSSSDSILEAEICNNVVYVVRSGTKLATSRTDDEAKRALLQLAKDSGKENANHQQVLEKFQHVNLVWMKNCSRQLHSNEGVLNLKADGMSKVIKDLIQKMMDESEISQKIGGLGGVTIGNMAEFFESVSKKIYYDLKDVAEFKNLRLMETTQEESHPTTSLENNIGTAKCNEILNRDMEHLKIDSMETEKSVNTTTVQEENIKEAVCIEESTITPSVKKSNRILRQEFFEGSCNTTTYCSISYASSTTTENYPNPHTAVNSSSQFQTNQVESKPEVAETPKQSSQNEKGSRNSQNDEGNEKNTPKQADFIRKISSDHFTHISSSSEDQQHVSNTTEEESRMEVDNSTNETTYTSTGENEHVSTSLPGTVIRNAIVKSYVEPMDVDDDMAVNNAAKELDAKAKEKMISEKKKAEEEQKNLEKEKLAEQRKMAVKAMQEKEKADKKVEEERIRKEKAEELRKQDEKARSVMEEFVPTAASQVKCMLEPTTVFWINNHLNLSSVNQVETVYAHAFSNTLENEYRHLVHPKLWREFTDRVDDHCKEECIQVLKCISKPLMKINQAIKKQFDFHGHFKPSKLEQFIHEEVEKETNTLSGFVMKTIEIATDRLLQIYQVHNQLIIEAEVAVSQIAMNEVEGVYHEQMKHYLIDAPYSTPSLQNIHSKLVEKLVDAFKMACHLAKSLDESVASEGFILKERLDKQFGQYKVSNERKLFKLQEDARKVILKMKSQYNEKVEEEIFQKNPDGLDARTLGKYHTAITIEMMKLLEMEIRAKVRQDEPLENHRKVLQSHIDHYWKTVLEVNNKNTKKAGERKEMEKREQRKLEAQRKIEEQERAAANRRIIGDSGVDSQGRTRTSEFRNVDQAGRPNLPPLVFHLQSTNIVMAMRTAEGHVDILKNESREEQTPAFIVYTRSKKIIYGSAALALVQSPPDAEKCSFQWSIGDFFLGNDTFLSEVNIQINDEDHSITSEFLLGYLLRKLKQTAEYELRGTCDTAVIAIPFWLSSTQRIKVKDGANIAGFSEIYLINEGSAAAYNFVLRDMGCGSGDVIVISENLNHFCAFVYTYNIYDKKLRMIAHAGDYDDTEKKDGLRKSLVKGFKSLIHALASYLLSEEMEPPTKQDEIKKTIRDVCKQVLTSAGNHSKLEPSESLYICENSSKWEDILQTVATGFARKAVDIKLESAVIFGAVALSQNPKEIGTLVRDMLAHQVFRRRIVGGVQVTGKKDVLPENKQRLATTLPHGHGEASFYQQILGIFHEIGTVTVSGVWCGQALEPNLEVTNEGIVTLADVLISSSNSNSKSRVSPEQVHWNTSKLSDVKRDNLIDLLDLSISPVPKEDPELTQAKEMLLNKCTIMTEKLYNDQFKIKSQLAKERVLNMISDARQFAEHPNSTLQDIEKKMKILQELCEKYDKK